MGVKEELQNLRDQILPSTMTMIGQEITGHIQRITGGMEAQMEEGAARLKKEVTERKRLHNLVQELRGNIRVFCRCARRWGWGTRLRSGGRRGATLDARAQHDACGPLRRVRPLSEQNLKNGQSAAVSFPSETDVVLDAGGKLQSFQYDRVFEPAATAQEVFEETQPLVVRGPQPHPPSLRTADPTPRLRRRWAERGA